MWKHIGKHNFHFIRSEFLDKRFPSIVCLSHLFFWDNYASRTNVVCYLIVIYNKTVEENGRYVKTCNIHFYNEIETKAPLHLMTKVEIFR